jgi:hypothetical protein
MKHITISLTYESDQHLMTVLENMVKNIRQGREKENYIEKKVEVVFQTFEIDTAKADREMRKELINGKMHIIVKSKI